MWILKVRFKNQSLLGITLFPFILINKWLFDSIDGKNNRITKSSIDVIINHEKIHIRQQLEMLVIPFYIWYGIEYLIRFFQYRKKLRFIPNNRIWDKAYQNISFEREAYKHERDLNYLKTRKYCSWFKYLWFKNYNKWS